MSYKSSPNAFTADLVSHGWSPREHNIEPAIQQWGIAQTANSIAGFTSLNVDKDGQFAAAVEVFKKGEQDSIGAVIGGMHEARVFSATARILSFEPNDKRIQTGTVAMSTLRPKGVVPKFGEEFSTQIAFDPPFKSAPRVAVFISKLDCSSENHARADACVTDITADKATLKLGTWANTYLYDLGVYFIAYEADDATIRSGTFEAYNPPMGHNQMNHKGKVVFDPPMADTPLSVMHAFSHIESHLDAPLRIGSGIFSLDRFGFEWELFTPEPFKDCRFNRLRCDWIAVL